jgi:Uma2 family endonuclease
MKPLKTGATYDDLCDVSELFIAEIIDGDLYASPRPPFRHAYAASVLAGELGSLVDRRGNGPNSWIMLNKPELHLASDVLVPDITGWRRSRLPELPDAAFMTLAPDWICEVLSAATETLDRGKKLRIYAREGVEHAWLLDPVRRALEVLVLRAGAWEPVIELKGDGKVRAPPFDTIELELGALWIHG